MKQTRRKFDKVEPNTAEITLLSHSRADTPACENNALLNGIKLNFSPSNIDKYILQKTKVFPLKKCVHFFLSPIPTMMLSQIVRVRVFGSAYEFN